MDLHEVDGYAKNKLSTLLGASREDKNKLSTLLIASS